MISVNDEYSQEKTCEYKGELYSKTKGDKLFGWALTNDDKLIHISQVPRGLACNCFCPCCKSPLLAKKGNVNVHHFAHAKGSEDCKHGYESAVHLLAKSVLEKEKTLSLPPYTVSSDNIPDEEIASLMEGIYGYEYVHPSQTFTFDEIQNEVHLEDITPDSIAVKNGTKLLVEFRYTHAVDEAKFEKIKAKGLSCVEIDLRHFKLSESKEEDEANMQLFLSKESASHSKWIFNYKMRERAKKYFENIRKERAPELEERRKEKVRREQWDENSQIIMDSLKSNYHNLLSISRQVPSANECIFTVTLRRLSEFPYGTSTGFQKLLYKPYCWNGILYRAERKTGKPNDKKIYFYDEDQRPYYVSRMVPPGQAISYEDIIKRIYWAKHEILDRDRCLRCPYARYIHTYGDIDFYYSEHTYIFCTRIEPLPEFLSPLL